MAYEKSNVVGFAESIFEAVLAFRDGFQLTDDSAEIMSVVTGLISAADEFGEDAGAAILHLSGRLAELAGDMRQPGPPVP